MIDIDTINFRRLLENGVKFTIHLEYPDSSTETLHSWNIDRTHSFRPYFVRSPLEEGFAPQHFGDNGLAHELDLSEDHRVRAHVESCFKAVQQLQCKAIAKQYIKVLEPKKQSNHPYKLGDASKPSWWPAGVRHIEPDHLRKNERLKLLLAIVFHPDADFKKYKASTEGSLNLGPRKTKLLDEIYFVVDSWKKYRQGELLCKVIKISSFEKTSIENKAANAKFQEHSDFNDMVNIRIPSSVSEASTPRTISDTNYQPNFGSQMMGVITTDPFLIENEAVNRLYPYVKRRLV